jgi:hypothetical protein
VDFGWTAKPPLTCEDAEFSTIHSSYYYDYPLRDLFLVETETGEEKVSRCEVPMRT